VSAADGAPGGSAEVANGPASGEMSEDSKDSDAGSIDSGADDSEGDEGAAAWAYKHCQPCRAVWVTQGVTILLVTVLGTRSQALNLFCMGCTDRHQSICCVLFCYFMRRACLCANRARAGQHMGRPPFGACMAYIPARNAAEQAPLVAGPWPPLGADR